MGALRTLLTDEAALAEARANVARVAQRYTWPVVLAPLVEFCRAPRRAADADRLRKGGAGVAIDFDSLPLLTRARLDAKAVVSHLRSGGVRAVADKVKLRVAKLRSR